MLFYACGGQTTAVAEAPKALSGYDVFKIHCRTCHGADGRMGLNGAKPLPESVMTLEQRIEHISKGKGVMQPYKDILSAEQI